MIDKQLSDMELYVQWLIDAAHRVRREYWAQKYLHHNQRGGAGLYGCRIKQTHKRYMNIVWFVLERHYAKRARNGALAATRQLTKGPSYRYPAKAFALALPWEAELIASTDAKFAILRRHYQLAMKMIATLKRMQKLPPIDPPFNQR